MEKEKYKILIVDDEEDICEILQFNLEGEGYLTDSAYSAEEALKKNLSTYHLLLLDVMMGQMSGFKLAEKIHKEMKLSIPIIFITAKNTENDLLTGFNIGADDYITKPFSIKEVLARVKAILNRSKTKDVNKVPSIFFQDMELNYEKRMLIIKDKKIELTKKEFGILDLLLNNIGRILSREEILSHVWSEDVIVTERTVDVHITKLRRKLDKYKDFVKSKHGYGYTFSDSN